MDFGRNVLTNNVDPGSTEGWDIANIEIGGTTPDRYFIIKKDSAMTQKVSDKQLQYTPRQLKLEVIMTPSSSITYYSQPIKVTIRVRFVDGSVQNITAVLSPKRHIDNGKIMYVNFVDIKYESTLIEAIVSILPFKMSGEEFCHVSSIKLSPSIDLDPGMMDAIQSKLPNLLYYSNKRALDGIGSSVTNIAHITIAMAASANLTMGFFIKGTIIIDDGASNPYVEFSYLLNNNNTVYSTVKVPVLSPLFVIGLPLPIMQVPSGSNIFNIDASCYGCKLSVPAEGIQITIEGKNIEGGYDSEPPHAEVREEVDYNKYVKAFKSKSNTIKTTIATNQQKPMPLNIDLNAASNDIDYSSIKTITDTLSVVLTRRGEIVFVDDKHDTLILDKDVTTDEYGTVINYNHTSDANTISIDSGYAQEFKVITTGYKEIEEAEVKNVD